MARHHLRRGALVFALTLAGQTLAIADPAIVREGALEAVREAGDGRQVETPRLRTRARRAVAGTLARGAEAVGGLADRTADHLRAAGDKLVEQGGRKARLGKLVRGVGEGIELAAGTETLKNISFQAGLAVVLPYPGNPLAGNVSAAGRLWSGSVGYWSEHVEGDNTEKHFTKGLVLNTPIAAAGWDSLWGMPYMSVSAPFVSLLRGQRAYQLTVGLPFALSVGVGKVKAIKPGQYERGSYLQVTTATPLRLGPFRLGVAASLYYRPFGLIADRLEGPVRWYAKKFDQATAPIHRGIDRLKERFRHPGAPVASP